MVQKHLDDFAHGGACIFDFLHAFQRQRRTHLGSVIFSVQCHSIGSIFLFPRRLCHRSSVPYLPTIWYSLDQVNCPRDAAGCYVNISRGSLKIFKSMRAPSCNRVFIETLGCWPILSFMACIMLIGQGYEKHT